MISSLESTSEHLKVVEMCAPLGIHVMVEKPLAVSWAHAEKMMAFAKKYNIHLLTNYETARKSAKTGKTVKLKK